MSAILLQERFLPNARVYTGHLADHSFFVKTDGSVYACGSNEYGQLAIASPRSVAKPTFVEFFSAHSINLSQISCGKHNTLFLTDQGTIWQSGILEFGRRLDRNPERLSTPQRIKSLDGIDVIAVAAEDKCGFCLSSDGIVYSFVGYEENRDSYRGETVTAPRRVSFPEGAHRIVRFSVGYMSLAAVSEAGTVYICRRATKMPWLFNGDAYFTKPGTVIFPTPNRNRLVQVICGKEHTTVLYPGKGVFSMGKNVDGVLGIGSSPFQRLPVRIPWFDHYEVKKMSIGAYHTVALLESGDLVSYGRNLYDQLCLGDQKSRNVPTFVPFKDIDGVPVQDIVCGKFHTIIVTEDGSCYGYGRIGAVSGLNGSKEAPPVKLMDDVDLGQDYNHANEFIKYIRDEQNFGGKDLKTTDFCLKVSENGQEHPIWLNRALLAARCSNILKYEDMVVETQFADFSAAILKYLYTDSSISGHLGLEIEKLCGNRRISIRDCLSRLFKAKGDEGDVSINAQNDAHYRAHKFVLVARSAYFRSIFRDRMWSEACTSAVQLEMSLDASFELWLKYLYTGRRVHVDSVTDVKFNEYCDYFDVN